MRSPLDRHTVSAALAQLVGAGGTLHPLAPDAALPPGWCPAPGGVPAAWSDLADPPAQILAFLASAVQGLYVARHREGGCSLIYTYTVDGDPCFYRGRPPLNGIPERFASIWAQLPRSLQRFYLELHDGWTFVPANSMGPLPVDDWAYLSDDRFDIDTDTARRMPVDPGRLLAVFHNGAGDFLCLHVPEDGVTPASGMIWWHEQPAEPEAVDFMATLDAWVGLFVEEANRSPS